MSGFDDLRLSPYYLNSRRLMAISGVSFPLAAQASVVRNSDARVEAMYGVASLAERMLRSGKIPNLTSTYPNVAPEGERILGFLWCVFIFKGASQAIIREQEGRAIKNATFRGAVPLGGEEFEVFGELYNDHYFSASSPGMLSGKKRMLIAGQFQFDGQRIEAFPYIIGEVAKEMGILSEPWKTSIRVHPSMIDAFKAIEGIIVNKEDIKKVTKISENEIKNVFAEILGEPFVGKDWGGEMSDLSTARLTVDGRSTSAAFIFKGPSVRGEMHPRDMGKRGDQLIRAFDEAAELIIVQHCDAISSNVVRMTEALAYDLRRPRRYCIIDGADTTRILKAYGKLPS